MTAADLYSLVTAAELQLCSEGTVETSRLPKTNNAEFSRVWSTHPFPSLLVSVLHNSRESFRLWVLPSQDGGRNCLQTDLLYVFVLPCFGVRGRVQLCLPAAGCTRAADMTALTNKRTGRDAHRCMLRRTQTAQYEATPLPVPRQPGVSRMRLQAYSTPPPPPRHTSPSLTPERLQDWVGKRSQVTLGRSLPVSRCLCDLFRVEQIKRNNKNKTCEISFLSKWTKNLVQTAISTFFNPKSLKTLNCRQTRGEILWCCFTFVLNMKII